MGNQSLYDSLIRSDGKLVLTCQYVRTHTAVNLPSKQLERTISSASEWLHMVKAAAVATQTSASVSVRGMCEGVLNFEFILHIN